MIQKDSKRRTKEYILIRGEFSTPEETIQFADQWIVKNSTISYAKRNSYWRSLPPTPNQLKLVNKFMKKTEGSKSPYPLHTRGRISDWMNKKFSEKDFDDIARFKAASAIGSSMQ